MLSAKPDQLLGPLNDLEAKYAPPVLFVEGDQTLLRRGPRVSMIGSRRASRAGIQRAEALSQWLVSVGAVVVSGLAEGIDTASHEAAIRAGGRTIAVLGTPLNQFSPARNRALQLKIMREHLAISQFAIGSFVGKGNFPMRNRTMALVSHATIIVEAGSTSGTMHQGWEAIRLGRPLFILDEVLDVPGMQWAAEMIEYGAMPLSATDPALIAEFLPSKGGVPQVNAVA